MIQIERINSILEHKVMKQKQIAILQEELHKIY